MSSKLYDKYKNEYVKMEKTHRELVKMTAVINKFAEALNDDYSLITVAGYKDVPIQQGIGSKHHFNAKDWPSSQQLIGHLVDMLKAYNRAKNYWNNLPPDEQKLINPPILPKPK